AANYGEARRGKPGRFFIHKLKVVFKELNETSVWLEIIAHASLLPAATVTSILAEKRELCRIIGSSFKRRVGAGNSWSVGHLVVWSVGSLNKYITQRTTSQLSVDSFSSQRDLSAVRQGSP